MKASMSTLSHDSRLPQHKVCRLVMKIGMLCEVMFTVEADKGAKTPFLKYVPTTTLTHPSIHTLNASAYASKDSAISSPNKSCTTLSSGPLNVSLDS